MPNWLIIAVKKEEENREGRVLKMYVISLVYIQSLKGMNNSSIKSLLERNKHWDYPKDTKNS